MSYSDSDHEAANPGIGPQSSEKDHPGVDVFHYPKQDAKQRFGKAFDLAEMVPMVGNSYDDSCFEDAPCTLPHFEMWRMNLTAFSQCYNLYFVAIRNQIYVYRPRNLAQAIPGKPDVVIRPPALTGLPKPTSIYPNHPHCVNSLIIGNLGKLEILLIAFDDGDVYSYYTKDIEAEVQSRKTDRNLSTLAEIKPFFRESVNDSAWGLAIQSELCIIAISSNDRRITLFCFALNDSQPCSKYEDKSMDAITDAISKQECSCSNWHEGKWCSIDHSRWILPNCLLEILAESLCETLRISSIRRERIQNTKVLLDMGISGLDSDNIPMLAFSSSPLPSSGETLLVAQDIYGRTFIITLPKVPHNDKITVRKVSSNPGHRSMTLPHFDSGWTITVLESDFFKDSPFSITKKSPAILCTSIEDVALWQMDYPHLAVIRNTPHLHGSDPLFNHRLRVTRGIQDRLSMVLKVPELYLVIVGSPIGMVALFTNICITVDASYPTRNPFGQRQMYSIDMCEFCITLPTRWQQLHGDRPKAILIGIAVAPIQGEENDSKKAEFMKQLQPGPVSMDFDFHSRRFRLLLHYDDHTILSYDLSRARDGHPRTDA